ncbi:hypothetical protein FHS35_000021 [Streptomyces umbrinus]|jgi:hypothetical protein|nr:hypothetical protein [Streptomyces umbrinus]GHB87509.1 hypothetical protein GCM10010306_098190 [Streptomyces umbrinus]GHH67674.1 hypothetical protein GCM10018775_91430 [Streptomyces umbrinus]
MAVRLLLLTDDITPFPPMGARRLALRPSRNRIAPALVQRIMESRCWLVVLPAIDGRQYAYRVYAPEDALLADLFWDAWHCHDEGPYPRAWDLFDAAVIRRVD